MAWLTFFRQHGLVNGVKKLMDMNIIKMGTLVGVDKYGNKYFQNDAEKAIGGDRWVEFGRSDFDASQVPPEWHSWLHHMSEVPGEKLAQERPKYAEDHIGNVTGTPLAYHPHNFMLNKEWQPVVQRGATYSRWEPKPTTDKK